MRVCVGGGRPRVVSVVAQAEGDVPDDYVHAIRDLREYDVPYYQRVCIDCDIRVGAWFVVKPRVGGVDVRRSDMVRWGLAGVAQGVSCREPRCCARRR